MTVRRLILLVYMQKGEVPPDTVLPQPPALYPNPASSVIKALLPEEVTGNVNVMIFNHAGQIVIYYDTECYKDVPLNINIGRLPSGTYSVQFTNSKRKSSCRGRFIVIK